MSYRLRKTIVACDDAQLGFVCDCQGGCVRPGQHEAQSAVDTECFDLDADDRSGGHTIDLYRAGGWIDVPCVAQLPNLIGPRDGTCPAVVSLDAEGLSYAKRSQLLDAEGRGRTSGSYGRSFRPSQPLLARREVVGGSLAPDPDRTSGEVCDQKKRRPVI